ncbi:hypothetical protein EMEDMD4_860003 [Sinorhizobium medicae]|uniref:Uncharacterized protein n=1 Tax=Sinorhizobium medicae TaxID=110321 RepID=A0A508X728_9HYPH|nr:hypothetical protein EMEDMD4_860003 [Sinorhizobium medicae]
MALSNILISVLLVVGARSFIVSVSM